MQEKHKKMSLFNVLRTDPEKLRMWIQDKLYSPSLAGKDFQARKSSHRSIHPYNSLS